MGQFRDLMEKQLHIRGYSPKTIECYLDRAKHFVRYFMRPPDELTLEDIVRGAHPVRSGEGVDGSPAGAS